MALVVLAGFSVMLGVEDIGVEDIGMEAAVAVPAGIPLSPPAGALMPAAVDGADEADGGTEAG